MNEQHLKNRILKMSLEDKILELTQFIERMLSLEESQVVTGVSNWGEPSYSQLWRLGSILNSNNAESVIAIRKTRREKGIEEPIIVMHDVIHGYRTIYPIPLAMSCSFNTDLIENCAEMAGNEAKYDGIDVTFSPMVDLVRDARWGRVMESAGEDPYLCGEVGKAFIRGYHNADIACCVKHFAAYGAAEAGREYNTTDISEHNLKEYYLRGYQACMDEKPKMVMSSFNALNGIPVLGNKKIMVDTLRTEWGFDGVLISDYCSVAEMISHGYCEDKKAGAKVAIDGKLDIEMCSPCYIEGLPGLVAEGKVKEEQIDEAVLRVLKLKNKLGLYENPDRYTNVTKRDEVTLNPEYRALARKAAEESCVLLKNNSVLPLNKNSKIALIGPFSDDKDIIGNWAARGKKEDAITIKEGVEALLGRQVLCASGCSANIDEEDISDVSSAIEEAKKAEIIIACIGEHQSHSGEAHSRANLSLSKAQKTLLCELKKLLKPIVLVVFGGRPLTLMEEEKLADAILYAWQPGTEGGNAIARLLYGESNPCGKTTMSFPRVVGQCPIYYNSYSTGRPYTESNTRWVSHYDDIPNEPLYPFGYGLSYTTFSYSDLRLSGTVMERDKKLRASVLVKNTGTKDGKEVVQWYIRDLFGSCVRPLKELKGFEKIYLKAGEEKTVTFEIDEKKLAFYTASGEFKAECGKFVLFVGGNSVDCLEANFELKD